jgi:hypothetical protein
MSDLNFITDGTIDRVLQRRSHREAILRNCAKHDLDLALNYAEAALDHIGTCAALDTGSRTNCARHGQR